MIDEFLELKELQAGIKDGLEALFPDSLWVRAEVAAVQVKSNGHCYLDLCQSEDGLTVAKARAVIWRSSYLPISRYLDETLGGPLQPGMQILCRVRVNYSELYSLSLTVDEIEPQFTLGAAEMERRRTVTRLSEEGLLDLQKKLVPAVLPYRLAVISAADAAGYGDFCRHLEGNPYGFKFSVTLFEASMQGLTAPASITDALQAVETSSVPYDAALILRGGGSALDLACFDDYGLAVAIANCPVPVYTAIGHDRDYHVADMVAFRFVKTPTALSDEFIDAFAAEDERISQYSHRLKMAFLGRVSSMEAGLEALSARIVASDPRKVLERGFVLATDSSGRVVKTAAQISKGERMRLLFRDGIAEIEVKELKI